MIKVEKSRFNELAFINPVWQIRILAANFRSASTFSQDISQIYSQQLKKLGNS